MGEAMESVSFSVPKRSYSWWWDSHITPKNSKWLQENLADMDSKIESMIMLIEEDADSFARRAEMYYKKRPELMKLVEEFYRAYRALAERYDHVTGALRQAHRTIAVAFPNQIQFILPDEPPSALPDTVEEVKDNFTSPSYSNGSREPAGENISFMSKEEWKQLNCLLAEDEAQKKFTECFLMKGLNLNQMISQPEISRDPEEVCHLNDEICMNVPTLDVTDERCLDLQKENTSLQSELNDFNKIVSRQMEEVLNLTKKNQNLHNKIESESIRAELAEAESCTLRDVISKLRLGTNTRLLLDKVSQERLSDPKTEISCTGDQFPNFSNEMFVGSSILNMAEEQYIILQEENNTLQHTVDEFKKIVAGQEEEVTLKEEESNKFTQSIQDELKNKSNPEERYHELKKRIVEVNFNLVSLRALIKELHDWKREPKGFNLGDSEPDVNAELKLLREEIKGLEYYCESVQRDSPNHESQYTALVSHFEAADQNIKKLLEKSRFFENSLSDIFVEFEGLREKMKALEESCKPLFHQNRDLVTENSNLITQLENIEQEMQSLEDRFSNFEGKYVNMEKENDLLRTEKEGQDNHVLFLRNRTCDLNNQIQILREENEHLNEELEDEQHNAVKSGIDFYIMRNFLYDMNEKNLILSDECQMHMKKLRRAEKLASEFKQDQLMQKKILGVLLDHESEKTNEEISFLHEKNYELTEVNEKLGKDFTTSDRQKEEINIETEEMHTKLSELLAGRRISHGEIPELLAEIRSLSNKLYELKEQKNVALKGAMIHDHLSGTFSSDTEKSSTIDQLASGVHNLNRITNDRKDDEIDFLRESNNKFAAESSIWPKNTEALTRRNKILTDELQRAKDENKHFEEESMACLFDIHVASINELMYEQKIFELMLKLKNLEAFEEGSLRNVEREVLMEKLHALENENKELKEELTGYLPLVVSLVNDITSLEELTLSPANLSSKKKQGDDHIPMVSSVILVLKKLHATVKLLQKEVSNTERLLAQEETVVDSISLCKTRENKAGRSKRSTAQQETKKKKDIVFDSKKSNEHITKDIELDHVSSIRSDFRADSDEQAPKMLEAAVNYVKEDQDIEIMEGERSENPSSDFVLEKELSIDTIVLPENFSKSHQEWNARISEILSSELQNTQKSSLEIQEEEESKEAKALQRKSRISFKGFLYGRRDDSRQKKKRFCACLGLRNRDD